MGWSLVCLASNAGEVNEKLLGVIACGEGARNYGKKIKGDLSSDTERFYQCPSELKSRIQILSQLRIVGKDKYAEASGSRGFIVKIVEKWISGISQGDINDYCREQNTNIEEMCKKHNIYVKKSNPKVCISNKAVLGLKIIINLGTGIPSIFSIVYYGFCMKQW